MALDELTSREAVLEAIAEYDRIGGPAFLAKYGYRPAKRYFIEHNGRRRFAFVTLEPAFGSERFRDHLIASGAEPPLADRLIRGMGELNASIADDRVNLGAGFRIGHSFFTKAGEMDEAWLKMVVETEIRPLLEEYWFDDPDKARQWSERLIAS